MFCNKCKVRTLTRLRYIEMVDHNICMCGDCSHCGLRFIPKIPNLDIPTIKSKKLLKAEKDTRPDLGLFSPMETESQ